MKNKKRSFWGTCFLTLIFAFPLLFTSNVQATPSATATYTEIDLGGGLWEYDYTLTNTSDPIAYAGYDIYDFFLLIDPNANLSGITSPANWDQGGSPFSDSLSFINWFSYSADSDIAPGISLSGFNFTSDTRFLTSLVFDATITNPSDPDFPVVISDASSPETTPVPEPATLLLLGNGLIGLGYLGWRKSLRS